MKRQPDDMYKISNTWICISAILIALSASGSSVYAANGQTTGGSVQNSRSQVHALKVTLLSTMLVGDVKGMGEWGFSALVDGDGRSVLLDTGAHPDTVLQNARDLKIDLSEVKE